MKKQAITKNTSTIKKKPVKKKNSPSINTVKKTSAKDPAKEASGKKINNKTASSASKNKKIPVVKKNNAPRKTANKSIAKKSLDSIGQSKNRKINNTYNKRELFERKIRPTLRHLKTLCVEEHIPMFATFAVSNNKKETQYISDMVLALSRVRLTDNKLAKIILYLNDFKVSLPPHIMNDIREIQEYLYSIKNPQGGAGVVQKRLTKDTLLYINAIMNGDDDILLPGERFDPDVMVDFIDDDF